MLTNILLVPICPLDLHDFSCKYLIFHLIFSNCYVLFQIYVLEYILLFIPPYLEYYEVICCSEGIFHHDTLKIYTVFCIPLSHMVNQK